MRAGTYLCLAMIAAAIGVGGGHARADELPGLSGQAGSANPQPADPQPLASLAQFSRGSAALYQKISASIVRVRIDQGFASLLSGPQRKEFNEWVKSLSQDSPATQPREDASANRKTERRVLRAAENGAAPLPGAMARRPQMQALFRRFVEQKIKDTDDSKALEKWRLIQNRLQQPIAETSAVVIDNQGDAIIQGAWVKDGPPISIRVITHDGAEIGAKYLGSHAPRRLAVIRLDSPGLVPPLAIADGAPDSGELMMCVAAGTGAVGWIAAPDPISRKNADARFAVFGGEGKGPLYLFNADGQLAALGFDRFAWPMTVFNNDVKWICENQRDIKPRQLGVQYGPVPPELRRTVRALGNRTAIMVEGVSPGSPAQKAGLQKDDIIISVDQRPVWQLPQVQWDIATEKAPVPIGILRDGKEETLSMPLD